MNKNLKIVLISGAVAALGFVVYRYYRKQFKLLMNYNYKVTSVKIRSFSKNNVILDIVVRFFNQSKIEAEIKKIYLDVAVEGQNVGYIVEDKSFILPAKGSSDIPLTISFNPQLVLKNVLGIILAGVTKKDLNFSINGYANVKSGIISTTIPIKYSDRLSAYL